MEWPMFCLVVNRAKRLNDMMERLDVDPLRLVRLRQGDAYAEARDTCLHCHQAMDCVNWIETTPAGSARPEFCPNLALLESVKRT
jgi:hypothetical protein